MWLPGVLAAVLLAIYWPALNGTALWDDAGHITRTGLQSANGLWRIWFDIGATQQYYPLLHSAFWVLHRLIGDQMLGYHLVTLAMHGVAAWLVARIATRLAIPGAVFAALLFATHPLQVESVAWVSEMKNTLSAVFFLLALDSYLAFDAGGAGRRYVAALGLFVCALLSKSVTATLPIVVLLCVFYRRGTVTRRDLIQMGPFLLLAVVSGVLSVWVESNHIGASGESFALDWWRRAMLAGAVPWFYLSKILWPSSLSFFYPRWDVVSWTAINALPMAATVAVVAGAFVWRHRSRAPFAITAAFLVFLAPAAGFVNVYPFRFSFVANHFAYLATLAVIVPSAALLALVAQRLSRSTAWAAGGLLIVILGAASHVHARSFANDESLYRETLRQNPHSVIARSNLAVRLLAGSRSDLAEAEVLLRGATADDPSDMESAFNFAVTLERLGRYRESNEQYRTIQTRVGMLDPQRHADVYRGLGRTSIALGQTEDAIDAFSEAVRTAPGDAAAHSDLGLALAQAGRAASARPYLEVAARLQPSEANLSNLGALLLQMGDVAGATTTLAAALRINPSMPSARFNYALAQLQYGEALRRQGNLAGARAAFEAGLPFADDRQLNDRISQNLRSIGR